MAKLMYDELKDLMCGELNNIAKKGSLTKESLETAHKLASALTDIETYEAMKNKGFSEGSYRGGYRSYDNYGGSYMGGSYDGRRGRDGDNDGRYSERGGYRSYDGYSGHDGSMVDHLEDMLRTAKSEQEREQIRRWMREMNG